MHITYCEKKVEMGGGRYSNEVQTKCLPTYLHFVIMVQCSSPIKSTPSTLVNTAHRAVNISGYEKTTEGLSC